ncbi:MAG TPA: molybdopterin cofactor-binding domain-containing protein, partial [Caulobacteraceae bacterium]|nr:molybdopterin cofactor-binding domain-containing protein [Caulobacteraceae bacterium]
MNAQVSRRSVLGALVVSFSLSRAFAQEGGQQAAAAPNLPGSLRSTPMLDAWVRIDSAGQITVFTGKVELGQGIKTALIQIAAEELDVPPGAIRLITADTALTPDEGVTAGSHSMQDSGTAILNACANVRALLAEAAATQLSLAPAQVTTSGDGKMIAGGRSATYGELASSLSLHVQAKSNMPRRAGAHKQIGRDLRRVDIPAKLTGGPAYVHDLRLPGMLHARVLRGPSDGTSIDVSSVASQVEAMPGVVKLVRNGGFCAVVAEREWTAIQALQR